MRLQFLLTVLAAASAADEYISEDMLPRAVWPLHYQLNLIYSLEPSNNFSYFGSVDIQLKVRNATSKIVLHAQDFIIPPDGIQFLECQNAPEVETFKFFDYNLLSVELDRDLEEGANYTLNIPFYGNLNAGLKGVYIRSYIDQTTNNKEYLLATFFKTISARKAFPCFDEPRFKATFAINIGHHKRYRAVSNMPQYNSTTENLLDGIWSWDDIEEVFKQSRSEYVFDQFNVSMPMSTYLVAFVVSKFECRDISSGLSHTTFRIWARKDVIDYTTYGANIGPKILSHLEKYFNFSFPLPKIDMFAIPDFTTLSSGNWGLIIYRESMFLYDKELASFKAKRWIAKMVAKELASQWVGGLVTTIWWTDTEVNQGLESFVGSIGMKAVEPYWDVEWNYAVENVLGAMNPETHFYVFSEHSTMKAACLTRMMTMFLGQDVFRRALHKYLQKYSYSNAGREDQFNVLTKTSQEYRGLTRNVSIKEVIYTWFRPEHPLLNVVRNYDDSTLTVSQKLFLPDGGSVSNRLFWWIPLSILCESEVGSTSKQVQWLSPNEGTQKEHPLKHACSKEKWILFNYNMIAPYRINYDKRNWQLLSNSLSSSKMNNIPVLGRVQLLSDAFALAWSEQLDYSIALQLASYLQHETEYLPLNTGLDALDKIENILKRSQYYGTFQKFIRQLITNQYKQAGGLSQKKIVITENSVWMQILTSRWACKVNVPGCAENAIELFNAWMAEEDPDTNNPIPMDLRLTVCCTAIRRGSEREWQFMWDHKRALGKDAAIFALTRTNEVWILNQYLEWAVTDNTKVPRQYSTAVIVLITSTSTGYHIARDFIYTRIDDIFNAIMGRSDRLGKIITTLLNQFTTQKELDEFLAWRDKNDDYFQWHARAAVSQGIEDAKGRIAWVKRSRKVFVEKLKELTTEPEEKVT